MTSKNTIHYESSSKTFDTYIIAFCPDSDSWLVTTQRGFHYEYQKEFTTEQEGIDFFKKNPKIFHNIEVWMDIYDIPFWDKGVYLENMKEIIYF